MPRSLTAKQQKFVAAYLGAANGNATEAARLAGYAGNAVTLGCVGYDNLRKPQIADAVRSELAATERRGIAIKQARIDAKVDRWHALETVRLARADEIREQIAADAGLPDHRRRPVPAGWETGLLVRQVKAIPTGRGGSEIVTEFALDAVMLREYAALEKGVAEELGELVTKQEITHALAIREMAETLAEQSGLDANMVVAEAERILSGMGG